MRFFPSFWIGSIAQNEKLETPEIFKSAKTWILFLKLSNALPKHDI